VLVSGLRHRAGRLWGGPVGTSSLDANLEAGGHMCLRVESTSATHRLHGRVRDAKRMGTYS
jgi:hypothetical protein